MRGLKRAVTVKGGRGNVNEAGRIRREWWSQERFT